MKFKDLVDAFVKTVTESKAEVLLGTGIGLGVATTVLVAKGSPKAVKALEEVKKRETESDEEVTTVEHVVNCTKAVAPYYALPVVTGVAAVGCLIGSYKVSAGKIATLATAYTIADTKYKELDNKVKEELGEQKREKIKQSIAQDHVDEKGDEVPQRTTEMDPGDIWIHDAYFDKWFMSNFMAIKDAQDRLNQRLVFETYVSLNDFYYEIDQPTFRGGDDLGWNIDNGPIKIECRSTLNKRGEPCGEIEYDIAPRFDYRSLH